MNKYISWEGNLWGGLCGYSLFQLIVSSNIKGTVAMFLIFCVSIIGIILHLKGIKNEI